MRVPDYVSGLVILALSLGALAMTASFPSAIGQSLGPAAFPIVISSALAIATLLLIGGSLRRRFASPSEPAPEAEVRSNGIDLASLGVMAVIVAMPIVYILAVGKLGFLITSFTVMFITTFCLWGGLLRSVFFALGCVIVIDGVFRGIFGIPFDIGVLHIPWW